MELGIFVPTQIPCGHFSKFWILKMTDFIKQNFSSNLAFD